MKTIPKARYVCNYCQSFFKTIGEAENHMADNISHAHAGFDDIEAC
jgi:hypothetical protein